MLISSFLSSLYILDIIPLLDVGLVKIFSHSVGCHFVYTLLLYHKLGVYRFVDVHLGDIFLIHVF